MNIMFIVPALRGGGAERVAVTLASALCKEHHVTYVSYSDKGEPYPMNENVDVVYLNINSGKNYFKKLRNSVKRITELKKLKKQLSIDCAISFILGPNFDNVMSRGRERVIVSIRSKESVALSRIMAKANEFACKKADCVVTVSRNIMADQTKNFNTPKDKIVTIYNPCDAEGIRIKAAESISDDTFNVIRDGSDFMLITAGRLVSAKGHWHLIRAFSKVVESKPNAVLVILGQGGIENLEDYLNGLIDSLGLNENVFLLGFKRNPYQYLSKADLFAFTSIFEGFGNILLEAMACGLPIISCDCDAGPRELLDPGSDSFAFAKRIEHAEYGVLAEVMDGTKYSWSDALTKQETEFADEIVRLIDSPELLAHYRAQGKKRVQDFSVKSVIDEWMKVICP